VPRAAFALVEKHFGAIPRRTPPVPAEVGEPPQQGERRVVVEKNAELPAVLIGWKGVAVADPDRPVLDLVERLLGGGDSARLQRDLVRQHEVATAVETNNSWGIQQDLFWIYAQARPKKTAADLERRIDAVVGALVERPVPEDELAKAKNQLKAELVRSLKTVSGKANQLGYLDVIFGDYRALFGLEAAWDGVTAADVLRVARAHLVPARRTVVELRPVPAEGPPLGDTPPKGGGAAT
jgi:zinc protease